MYGYKWVLMANNDNYKIVVPFYVRDVKQPIMSSNSTDRRRVQHTVQRYTNNVTQQRLSLQLGKKSWILLPSSEAGQHSRQHETRHLHDWNNRISSNHTSDHYTNRNGSSQKQEWYMDIQLTRISGQNTQDNMQSTLRTRQQMSNTNRQTWELQKDHRLLTQWQQRRLWGQVSRSQKATTEKSPAWTNVDRRNVVQSEERNHSPRQQTTTATSSTISNIQGTRSNNDISVISTTAGDKTYIQETNWKHTTTTSASIYISNFDSTSQRCSTNIRLLGQRRQQVETSTCPTTKGFVPYHNKQTMDQTLQDWRNKEDPSSDPWMEQEDIQWKMIGQQRDKQHVTKNGQDQQTLKNVHSSRTSSSQKTSMNNKKQEKAKGIPAPRQPTEQERIEHELTHLPYRSWCPLCVQGKGRADNHPKQHSKTPVIQVDITYCKSIRETKTTPVLTAVWHRNGHVYGSTNWRQKHITCNTCQLAYNNSWWNAAEHKQHWTTQWYSQTKKTSWKH